MILIKLILSSLSGLVRYLHTGPIHGYEVILFGKNGREDSVNIELEDVENE